jgi:hypothetical protein
MTDEAGGPLLWSRMTAIKFCSDLRGRLFLSRVLQLGDIVRSPAPECRIGHTQYSLSSSPEKETANLEKVPVGGTKYANTLYRNVASVSRCA